MLLFSVHLISKCQLICCVLGCAFCLSLCCHFLLFPSFHFVALLLGKETVGVYHPLSVHYFLVHSSSFSSMVKCCAADGHYCTQITIFTLIMNIILTFPFRYKNTQLDFLDRLVLGKDAVANNAAFKQAYIPSAARDDNNNGNDKQFPPFPSRLLPIPVLHNYVDSGDTAFHTLADEIMGDAHGFTAATVLVSEKPGDGYDTETTSSICFSLSELCFVCVKSVDYGDMHGVGALRDGTYPKAESGDHSPTCALHWAICGEDDPATAQKNDGDGRVSSAELHRMLSVDVPRTFQFLRFFQTQMGQNVIDASSTTLIACLFTLLSVCMYLNVRRFAILVQPKMRSAEHIGAAGYTQS